MGVDAGVAGSASEVFVFLVGNVLMGAGVLVLLGKTKVNDVYNIAVLAKTH